MTIALHPNHDQHLRKLAITAQCNECSQPFEFVGVSGPGAELSEDKRILQVTITESLAPEPKPTLEQETRAFMGRPPELDAAKDDGKVEKKERIQ